MSKENNIAWFINYKSLVYSLHYEASPLDGKFFWGFRQAAKYLEQTLTEHKNLYIPTSEEVPSLEDILYHDGFENDYGKFVITIINPYTGDLTDE